MDAAAETNSIKEDLSMSAGLNSSQAQFSNVNLWEGALEGTQADFWQCISIFHGDDACEGYQSSIS